MGEAGPSTIIQPTRVIAPDESQTIKFVDAIMRAFDTITEVNTDPILLLKEAKDILDQILSKINIVCMTDQRSTPFFAAIASVSTKHCNALLQRGISPTISSRTMNAVFAPEDSFNHYGAGRSEIVVETDEDDLISDIQNREKIINVCQIGVYLAMCNLILDIKIKNKKVDQKIKEEFVNKMKSLSKYNYAWNEAVEIIQGNEYELMVRSFIRLPFTALSDRN
ncbi:unnamed protein product [Meloidogyne enterolobii]|uniref:Uncharacterized protein n=1 Tax=Meloidogyne enterolobii TaxID=390850 RepID=A0ACB1A8K1_MELEN